MAQKKTSLPSKSKRKQTTQPKARLGKSLIVLVSLILSGLFAWALWPPAKNTSFKPEVTGAAALKPDQEKINLGEVHLGNTVSASFQLTNVGDQPLHFAKAPYIQVVEGC